MERISPAGFALAIVILIVIWLFVPDQAKGWLALLLILLALGADKRGPEAISRFFGLLR